MLKRIWCMLICGLLILSTFSGCKKEEVVFSYNGENSGTTCGNIMMGRGRFAYSDGCIYFYGGSGICEYNLETGKTVCLQGIGNEFTTVYLSDDFIYILKDDSFSNPDESGYSLIAVTKDGRSQETLFHWENMVNRSYLDGMELYNWYDGNLCRQNLETGEEECLISSVGGFYLDSEYIYVLGKGEDGDILYRSPRQQIQFESIQLPFDPHAFLPWEGQIFLTGKDSKGFYVVLYKDGEVTRLPVSSGKYQVLDDHLIYLDTADDVPNYSALKSYNLKTGEIKLLNSNASYGHGVSILEERYICFAVLRENESSKGTYYPLYTYYDWQTGEMKQMYPKKEK